MRLEPPRNRRATITPVTRTRTLGCSDSTAQYRRAGLASPGPNADEAIPAAGAERMNGMTPTRMVRKPTWRELMGGTRVRNRASRIRRPVNEPDNV